MSFKDDVFNGLAGTAVFKVEVDRDATIRGEAATTVTVHRADGHAPHVFTFAKANNMDAEAMAKVIRSYLPEMK